MNEPLMYGVNIEAEKVVSELVPTIAILEELKRINPKAFTIAIEAMQKMDD